MTKLYLAIPCYNRRSSEGFGGKTAKQIQHDDGRGKNFCRQPYCVY